MQSNKETQRGTFGLRKLPVCVCVCVCVYPGLCQECYGDNIHKKRNSRNIIWVCNAFTCLAFSISRAAFSCM